MYGEVSTLAADEWADLFFQALWESPGDLSNVTQLGSHYLSHLVIACMRFFCRKVSQFALTFYFFQVRNPGGKQTPQDTVHSTPDYRRIEEIEALLAQATINRSQSALKDLASSTSRLIGC